ncbi:hypothetical protein P3698_22375 [Vibrio parahaemolyticus]|nr:hypothetical protein [Vibrio parahaemolyticus]MDF5522469.1 hypothetical protein [Vibrio parahaemolyticus]
MSEFDIPNDAKNINDAEADLIKGSQARSTSAKPEATTKERGRPRLKEKKIPKSITVDQSTVDSHKEIRKQGDIIDFSGAVRAGIKMLQNASQEERRKIFEELNIKYD